MICLRTKLFLPPKIENVFTKIFLPHSKPLVVDTIYHPPSQGSFTEHFPKINTKDIEIYILGDFNINLRLKQKYVFHQMNTVTCDMKLKTISNFVLCMAWKN